jgi:hypothetical protein
VESPSTERPDVEPNAVSATDIASTYALCAEFPAVGSLPGDLEGWWNGTPANADGSIIQNPEDWPDSRPREHPRVAVVAVATAEVYSTWDRTTCGDDPTYTPIRTDQWPAVGEVDTVVLDMDTGEVLSAESLGG